MKKILKFLGILILLVLLAAGALLGYLSLTEYKPAEVEPVAVSGNENAVAVYAPGQELTLVSWNIGYGALGDNADFFMDGGKGVKTADRERVMQNLNGIAEQLGQLNPDLILLQEIDRDSERSWGIRETDWMRERFPDCAAVFANKCKVPYVPYPIPPIGRVDSGILTLSRAPIASAERYQLPCPFSWPIRLANLKRCLLSARIPLEGTERELVVVNLHLEAYDSGEGKVAQTAMLARILREEAEKGNYVIAGGDFNQLFSNIENPWPVYPDKWLPGVVDAEAFPGMLTLLMDPAVPTCRSLDRPLAGADPAQFQFYVIDGFIVSNNVEVESLQTLDLGFVCSDHNPVQLRVKLLPSED